MNDFELDKILHIHTSGRDDSILNHDVHPYEPTPYKVLEILSNSGYITKNNTLLDYGSGKGRVPYYMTYQTKCHSIGIELSKDLYNRSVSFKEKNTYMDKVSFINIDATKYILDKSIDRIFFFNPFSVNTLEEVIKKIKNSYNEFKREILVFFYYMSDSYFEAINKNSEFKLVEIIDLKDVLETIDNKESIHIYRLL